MELGKEHDIMELGKENKKVLKGLGKNNKKGINKLGKEDDLKNQEMKTNKI